MKIRIAQTALALELALMPAALPSAIGGDYEYGPFASKGEAVHGGERVQAAGPIFEKRVNPDGSRFLAIRPFYSFSKSPVFERTQREYLWPLATVRHFKNQRNWRFLVLAHGIDFDVNDDQSPYRTRVLPIYFQGRNSAGTDYLGIFPVGGKIYDILGRDEVTFVLFPIWMRHSVNNVVTRDWLWPIISKTTGPGIDRFRIFPFYGRSLDEDRYRKRFILWPIWTQAEWFKEGESGSGYILFPLWGHTETEIEKTWNIIPPFFRFTRGERRDLTYAPWPFYQRVSGDDLDKLYIWPLWGRKRMDSYRSSFILWPIVWHDRLDKGATERVRTMVLPFYYGSREEWSRPSEESDRPISRRCKIWPLFSYGRDSDSETSEFNTLALWPGKDLGPIERNWAPLWRIYTRSRDGDRFESELLWGIYRNRHEGEEKRSKTIFPLFSWHRDGDERGWSFLNGLAGSTKNGTNRVLRLLYIFEFGNNGEEK